RYAQKNKKNLIKLGVYKPFIDTLDQSEFDDIIRNINTVTSFDDFKQIISKLNLDKSHMSSFENRTKNFTNTDADILLHMMSILGFDLQDFWHSLRNVYFVAKLVEIYPDQHNAIFHAIKHADAYAALLQCKFDFSNYDF